jgi:cytochrome P450
VSSGYTPTPVLGALFDVARNGFFNVTMEVLARHGSPARIPILHRSLYAVGHPDHARHIALDHNDNWRRTRYHETMQLGLGRSTLTTDGGEWRERRKMVRPVFHRERIDRLVDTMTECLNEMLERWDSLGSGRIFDLMPEILHVTLRISTRCMFGSDLRIDGVRLAEHFETIQRFFRSAFFAPAGLRRRLPLPVSLAFRRAMRELDTAIREIMKRRRDGPQNDLLSSLLALRDESGKGLDDEAIRDEVITLLHSGHETVMNAILWTLYLVGRHPEVRERLELEVEQVLGRRAPTIDDLPRLSYAERVFKESMRLYPPVPAFSRTNLRDDEIGGMLLPAGSFLNTMIWAIHLHPEFWIRPREFDPERFTARSMETQHRFAYLPFAAGPHRCIGQRIAMLEGLTALTMIVQRFRLDPVGHVTPVPRVTLRPKDGMPMVVHARAQPRRSLLVADGR